MALPSLSKSWIFKTNTILPTTGASATDCRAAWLAIKKALTVSSGWTDANGSATTNTYPWTVAASSDAVVADTNDNWDTVADIVAPNSTHFSWIVLQQAAINPNFMVGFGLNPGSVGAEYNGAFVTSYSVGFTLTSLSVAAYPTASDQYISMSTTVAGSYPFGTGTFDGVLHVMMSTDGQCTRVILYRGNVPSVFWVLDRPKNPVTGWSNPAISHAPTNSGYVSEASYSWLTTNTYFAGYSGATMLMYCSTEYYSTTPVGSGLVLWDQVSQEWWCAPMGLVCATPGKYGRHADLFDMWFLPTGVPAGDTFPGTGSRQMVCAGNLLLPWNTSDCLTI